MDIFEVTVERFAKFYEQYPASLPVPGSGRNPHDPSDEGWKLEWDAYLPETQEALWAEIACEYVDDDVPYPDNWLLGTELGEERLPMDCVNWYVAFAFCIWDGGRLPTEAEWNYAAGGGDEQRLYPWGSSPLPKRGPYFSGEVGATSPGEDGRWGHADLSYHELEWVRDWWSEGLLDPCENCSGPPDGLQRVLRGTDDFSDAAPSAAEWRLGADPVAYDASVGVRCAR